MHSTCLDTLFCPLTNFILMAPNRRQRFVLFATLSKKSSQNHIAWKLSIRTQPALFFRNLSYLLCLVTANNASLGNGTTRFAQTETHDYLTIFVHRNTPIAHLPLSFCWLPAFRLQNYLIQYEYLGWL